MDPEPYDDDDDAEGEDAPTPEVPRLTARLLGVLTAPWSTFSIHHSGWGWAAPWLIVSALGILAGVLTVANGHVEAVVARQVEKQQEQFEAKGIEVNAEMLDFQRKLGIFSVKVGSVVGPPLAQLWYMFMIGTVVFMAGLIWGEAGASDLMLRSLSLAAWCSLADGVGYIAQAAAALLGSPTPATSLIHLVDPQAYPVLGAVLGRIDPAVIYYYLLLAAGLRGSCRLSGARGPLVAGGCFVLVSLLGLGLGFMASAAGG